MTIKFESTSKAPPLFQIRPKYVSESQSNWDFWPRSIAGDASVVTAYKWILGSSYLNKNQKHVWKMNDRPGRVTMFDNGLHHFPQRRPPASRKPESWLTFLLRYSWESPTIFRHPLFLVCTPSVEFFSTLRWMNDTRLLIRSVADWLGIFCTCCCWTVFSE